MCCLIIFTRNKLDLARMKMLPNSSHPSFNAQARYFNPKPRMKQSSNPEQYE
ncbi:hypothetical protein V6Z11_A05G054100 [Gossypium hirsutum]